MSAGGMGPVRHLENGIALADEVVLPCDAPDEHLPRGAAAERAVPRKEHTAGHAGPDRHYPVPRRRELRLRLPLHRAALGSLRPEELHRPRRAHLRPLLRPDGEVDEHLAHLRAAGPAGPRLRSLLAGGRGGPCRRGPGREAGDGSGDIQHLVVGRGDRGASSTGTRGSRSSSCGPSRLRSRC